MNKAEKERNYEIRRKKPVAAVIWSLIITGAGHWYMGKTGKGFAFLGIQCLLWFIIMGWIMWIITPIVAYKDCKKHNELLRMDLGLK